MIQTPAEYLALPSSRQALVDLVLSTTPLIDEAKSAIRTVLHRSQSSKTDVIALRDCFNLLADLMSRVLPALPVSDADALKRFVFEDCTFIIRLYQDPVTSAHLTSRQSSPMLTSPSYSSSFNSPAHSSQEYPGSSTGV
jgi:hypothetical protein